MTVELLTKFFPQKVFIDVSPGNYMLEELQQEEMFSVAIDYDAKAYFAALSVLVSKYDFFDESFPYKAQILKKTMLIPNGVAKPRRIKNNFTFKGKALLLGRIAASKFVTEIVQAFACFADLSLTIVGGVHEKEQAYFNNDVQPYLTENMSLHQPLHDTQTLMVDYDFIVVLGVHQGSPNTVLEALSVALPVISNDSGGTKQMLGNSGILLDNTSKASLEQAIKTMMHRYEYYAQQSIKRQQEVMKEFSMTTFVERYRKITCDGL